MLKLGICYGQAVTRTEVQEQSTTQVQIEEAVSPIHAPSIESPVRELWNTLPGTPRRPGTLYCLAPIHKQEQEIYLLGQR